MSDHKVNAEALLGALTGIGEAIGTIRKDGWANVQTGIGTDRDKQTFSYFTGTALLSDPTLSTLFHSDDIAHRIVATRPEEMLRAGYKVRTGDEELTKGLLEDRRRLDIDRNLLEGMIWGALYGGAGVILGTKDSSAPERPLKESSVRSVDFMVPLDRRYIFPSKFYGDAGPMISSFGKPEVYTVTSPTRGQLSNIHESRMIRFEGAMTDSQMRRMLNGWSISELQRPYEVLRLFGLSFMSVGHLLQDASQGVFKIKELMHMIANNRQALMDRMSLVDTSRSVARAILLDADEESFERVATSFAGLPELLDRIMQRMSAATRIPVTLLMGRSAAGMNATGDSDFRAYYDSVKAEQDRRLRPALLKIYRLLAVARGADPEQVEIEFLPLWEMTEAERSLAEKQDAERDNVLIQAGVYHPEEIALRNAKGLRSVFDIQVDVAARQKSLDIETKIQTDPSQHIGPGDEAKAAQDLATAKAKAAPDPASKPKKPLTKS